MLVLTRQIDERIWIGEEVVITVLEIRPGANGGNPQVRIGIEAPLEWRIDREEIRRRRRDGREGGGTR